MGSGSEAGLHLSLMDFVYHSTLVLRVIKKKKKKKSDELQLPTGIDRRGQHNSHLLFE